MADVYATCGTYLYQCINCGRYFYDYYGSQQISPPTGVRYSLEKIVCSSCRSGSKKENNNGHSIPHYSQNRNR